MRFAPQGKVRDGSKAELSPEMAAAMQTKWEELVQPVCGVATFADMRQRINRELKRPFKSCQ